MIQNKDKFHDYLEANKELEHEEEETQKINNDLNISILKQLSDNDHLQSEVKILNHNI